VLRTGIEQLATACDVASWGGLTEEERAIWATVTDSRIGCFPVAARGQTFGAIVFGGRAISTDAAPVGRELANQLAVAIDRARLYEAAREASRAREEMVAIVSHDLRSPLFAISARAQLLLRSESPSRAEIVTCAESMRRSVTRMNRLISDVLDGERIARGRVLLDVHPHDARGMIEDAIEPLRLKARDRDVRLEVEVPADSRVLCDRERISQVIANLVDNAIKFSTAGGCVRIGAARTGDAVSIRVDDSGEGITPEALPHIFERYWHGAQSGRSAVGLGLAIVKGIVDAHKGTITVESRRGEGTSIRFSLAAAPEGS